MLRVVIEFKHMGPLVDYTFELATCLFTGYDVSTARHGTFDY